MNAMTSSSGADSWLPGFGAGERKRRSAPQMKRKAKLGFVAALALIVEHGRRQALEKPVTKRCPRCRKVGRVETDFGARMIDGERRPQSWCRECRSAKAPVMPQVQVSLGL